MGNELMVKEFGTKEVRFEGTNKVNLVDVVKCCGLTRIANSGKEVVMWKNGKGGVTGKLENIYATKIARNIKEEIENILIEIDEVDDRNNIYISQWLAQRIATECNNELAHEFKSWLVDLNYSIQEAQQKSPTMQDLLNIQQQVGSIVQLFNQTVDATVSVVSQQTELINKQQEVYEQDRKELKEFIGLRAKQVKELSKRLMNKVNAHYHRKIYASDYIWQINRDTFLNNNGYNRW